MTEARWSRRRSEESKEIWPEIGHHALSGFTAAQPVEDDAAGPHSAAKSDARFTCAAKWPFLSHCSGRSATRRSTSTTVTSARSAAVRIRRSNVSRS